MKPNKKLAAVASAALVASVAGVAFAPSAFAESGSSATIQGSPANNFGTVWYDNGSVPQPATPGNPAQTIDFTATATGSSANITIALSQGPYASAASDLLPGAYRLDAFVKVDGGARQRIVGNVGTANVGANTPSFVGGTTITGAISGLSAGAHTIVLSDFLMDSDGPSSGAGFGTASNGSDAVGFDAWYNKGTTGAAIIAGTSPIGLSASITATGPSISVSGVTNLGTDGLLGGGDDTSIALGDAGVPYFRNGDALTVGGNSNWSTAAGTYLYWRVCNSDGVTGCSPQVAAVSNALAIPQGAAISVGAGGQLSNATIKMSTSTYTGNLALVLEQTNAPYPATFGPPFTGTVLKRATTAISVLAGSPNGPTVSGPSAVSPGSLVAVSGSYWYPGQQVEITTQDGASAVVDGPVIANGSGMGAISANITVNGGTQYVASDAFGKTASFAFGVTSGSCVAYTGNLTGGPGCDTQQNILAEVTGGTLEQAAGGDTVDLGTTQSGLGTASLNGNLNAIRVTDTRGGTYGWTLSATMTNFTDGGSNSIANSALLIDPNSVATIATSAPGVSDEILQDLGGTATLCVKDVQTNTSGTTGGQWDINAPLTLEVPAFQAAASYSALMTITLA